MLRIKTEFFEFLTSEKCFLERLVYEDRCFKSLPNDEYSGTFVSIQNIAYRPKLNWEHKKVFGRPCAAYVIKFDQISQ